MAILTSAGITFGDATTQSTAATTFAPSGTVMLFVQTAAPTGWTKSTTHNDKALRVVSGSVTTGGSVGFTTALGTPSVSGTISGSASATTLSTAQIPSHTHTYDRPNLSSTPGYQASSQVAKTITSGVATGATGGGGSHTHSLSASLSSATATINVSYVDVIIATKD